MSNHVNVPQNSMINMTITMIRNVNFQLYEFIIQTNLAGLNCFPAKEARHSGQRSMPQVCQAKPDWIACWKLCLLKEEMRSPTFSGGRQFSCVQGCLWSTFRRVAFGFAWAPCMKGFAAYCGLQRKSQYLDASVAFGPQRQMCKANMTWGRRACSV